MLIFLLWVSCGFVWDVTLVFCNFFFLSNFLITQKKYILLSGLANFSQAKISTNLDKIKRAQRGNFKLRYKPVSVWSILSAKKFPSFGTFKLEYTTLLIKFQWLKKNSRKNVRQFVPWIRTYNKRWRLQVQTSNIKIETFILNLTPQRTPNT